MGHRAASRRTVVCLCQALLAVGLGLMVAVPVQAQGALSSEGEVRVNTLATDVDFDVQVASAADGSSVVVWGAGSEGQSQVYARRYAADGAPQGAEWLVGSTRGGHSSLPAVGTASEGTFVIVWQTPAEGVSWRLRGRRFHADGEPDGATFTVTDTVSTDFESSVAVGADGFVVAWATEHEPDARGHTDRVNIYARWYGAEGAAKGEAIQVNAPMYGNRAWPSVAMDPSGRSVVVWESQALPSPHTDIHARWFSAEGIPEGVEIRVNDRAGYHSYPDVALDGSGRALIAWDRSGPVPPDSAGIYARRYGPDGTALTEAFRVSPTSDDWQSDVAVALGPDGQAVIVWDGMRQDLRSGGIYGRRYSASGVPLGAAFHVAYPHAVNPSVALDANGHALVVWSAWRAIRSAHAYARRF